MCPKNKLSAERHCLKEIVHITGYRVPVVTKHFPIQVSLSYNFISQCTNVLILAVKPLSSAKY